MKICCISDTHGIHHAIDLKPYRANILVHAGDWTKGRDNNFVETYDFLDWFSEQPYKHKLLIAGNHEVTVENNQKEFEEILEAYPEITYLNNSSVTIEGINFFGSPYSNEFCGWAFMGNDSELSKIWNGIPEDTNILVTHGPAYGVNDLVSNAFGRDPHVGSKSLSIRKAELPNLKAHISGHIHEAYNQQVIADVLHICPSILNERYQHVNSPIIIKVEND